MTGARLFSTISTSRLAFLCLPLPCGSMGSVQVLALCLWLLCRFWGFKFKSLCLPSKDFELLSHISSLSFKNCYLGLEKRLSGYRTETVLEEDPSSVLSTLVRQFVAAKNSSTKGASIPLWPPLVLAHPPHRYTNTHTFKSKIK